MATYLSDTYPVTRWRGREIRVLNTIAAGMKVVEFVDEQNGRTLFADEKYIVDTAPAPAVSPAVTSRMLILEELQKFESALFDVWDGSADANTMNEAYERLIEVYLGGKR